jgi:hypothetical protein
LYLRPLGLRPSPLRLSHLCRAPYAESIILRIADTRSGAARNCLNMSRQAYLTLARVVWFHIGNAQFWACHSNYSLNSVSLRIRSQKFAPMWVKKPRRSSGLSIAVTMKTKFQVR